MAWHISQEIDFSAKKLRELKAPPALLEWYMEHYPHGRDWIWKNLPNAEWILWLVSKGFKGCPSSTLAIAARKVLRLVIDVARKHPSLALEDFAEYLPPNVLSEIAKEEPIMAISCAAQHLSPKTLEEVARLRPEFALRCITHRLPRRVVRELKRKIRVRTCMSDEEVRDS